MMENFSSAYYRTMMDVQQYSDGPVIQSELYEFIDRKINPESHSPIMMRVGLDAGVTFEVEAERAIPKDVLAVPERFIDEPGPSNVFVLKSEYHDIIGDPDG